MIKITNLLFVLALIFMGFTSNAQTMKDFKKEINEISQAVSMDTEQNDKLNSIYEKRIADLASIDLLKETDELQFRSKRRAIYKGSETSIKLILRKEQLESYRNYSRVVRIRRSEEMKSLKKKKASQAEIIDAQYGIKN